MTGAEAVLMVVLLAALIAAYALNAHHYRKDTRDE